VTSAIKKQVISTFDNLAKQSRIDILVNNAGISQIGNVEATPEDAFARTIRVNVKGYYNCIYVCIGIRVNAIVPAEVMTPRSSCSSRPNHFQGFRCVPIFGVKRERFA